MFGIPEEKLPKQLCDNERLNVFYGPFRTKSLNSEHWETKLSAWQDLIYLYCSHNFVYSFSLNSLKLAFAKDGRTPYCLDTVLTEMRENGDIQNTDDFMKNAPMSWAQWASELVFKSPLNWTLKRLKSYQNDNTEIVFVPVAIIHEESDKLYELLRPHFDNNLKSALEVLDILEKDSSKLDDLKLLLHDLKCRGKVDLAVVTNEILKDSSNLVVKLGDSKITENDLAVYTLEHLEKVHMESVEKLEDLCIELRAQAKMQLLKGHKQLAKSSLRRKQVTEKEVLRKVDALHNIQNLLENLRNCTTNAHVWKTYQQAVAAFKYNLKSTGLSEENVDDTRSKISEMLDTHSDIQTALSSPIHEEDENYEAELAELLQQTSLKENKLTVSEEEEEPDLNLPDVPSDTIFSQSVLEKSQI